MCVFIKWLFQTTVKEIRRIPLNIKCVTRCETEMVLSFVALGWLLSCVMLFKGLGFILFLIPSSLTYLYLRYWTQKYGIYWCIDCKDWSWVEQQRKKLERKV